MMNNRAVIKPASMVLPSAWVILAVVYLASVAAPLNQAKVPPIMPVLMEIFRLNLSQAGMLMSVFAITGLILALPAGIILQRLGPKTTGLIALACLAGGSAIGALSTSVVQLLVSRVVEGIGMGLIGVVAPASIAMWFPQEKQGSAMGIWATWVPVGSVVMYNLAPALATRAGWQFVWWTGAGFALVVMVVYGLLMRMPPALEKSPTAGTDHAPGLRKALANRDIWLLALEFGCFNLVFLGLATFLPSFLSDVRGYTLSQAALIASLSTFVVLFSAPLAGWVSDRIGSRKLVLTIPFLLIAGMLLLPFHVTGWQLYAFMILLGVITGAIPTATFATAPDVMRNPQLAGVGLAVVMLGQNVGMLIGPVLFGKFVETLGWAPAGYWMIPFCVLGFAAGWMVKVR